MINELRNDVSIILKRERNYLSPNLIEIAILYLLYLKYLCEINEYNYEEVINSNEMYDILDIDPRCFANSRTVNNGTKINSVLRNFTGDKAKDLVLDLLNDNNSYNFYEIKEKKKLVDIVNINTFEFDYNLYDKEGKTTYICDKDNMGYKYYKILDRILGINNNYVDIDNIDYSKYDCIIIYHNAPNYKHFDDKICDYIKKSIHLIDNIYLLSKYDKISNFRAGRFILKYIKTILIKDDNIIMHFNKESSEISIINCNNPKVKDSKILDEIIKNNKKQKDVLTKTTYIEIIKNNTRIGFNLYQMKKDEIDINELVDQNTRYLDKLNDYNNIVEKEINNIFNK